MPDWMVQVVDSSATLPWDKLLVQLITRLVAALVFGMLVVGVYKVTRRSATVTATFPATLVLLSILIAMVTQVIGDNIARAFSLVGALSVVRFRTVVRDSKDTAFVIAAVAMGMAVGLGQGAVAACGIIVFGGGAYLFRDQATVVAAVLREMQIEIRLVWSPELEALVLKTLSNFATEIESVSASTVRHGVGMDLTYKLRMPPTASLTQLISELSRIEGVQAAELRKERDDN
jgi:energy-converting hydrogenase Eha subunit A